MPAIVDHDQRRRDIAAAVERLVSSKGIQNVTVRAVGAEAGFSAAIVGQYFQSKENLMTYTYLSARQRTNARMERALLENAGVFACLRECLPLDAARQAEWQVWFGFWGMAAENKTISDERHAGVTEANILFERILRQGKVAGEVPDDVDCLIQATRLQIFINGLAGVVLQAPKRWPAQAQQALLRAEIDMALGKPADYAGVPMLQ